MSKQTEKLKKQLGELSDVINSFSSENVQLWVTDRILNHLIQFNKQDSLDDTLVTSEEAIEIEINVSEEPENFTQPEPLTAKKPGPNKILNQLLTTDFFNTPRSLPEITDFINTNFDSGIFYTYQLSGVLLGLFKKGKLERVSKGGSGSYLYQLPTN